MVTNEGWVVVVDRDFREYDAIQLPGAEAAPAHNARLLAEGYRAGTGDWVRNSAAVDEDGGIYVPSLDEMHKVVWDGERLSTDPADGAWSEPYSNSTGLGLGATPTLMGFGDEDRFVVDHRRRRRDERRPVLARRGARTAGSRRPARAVTGGSPGSPGPTWATTTSADRCRPSSRSSSAATAPSS